MKRAEKLSVPAGMTVYASVDGWVVGILGSPTETYGEAVSRARGYSNAEDYAAPLREALEEVDRVLREQYGLQNADPGDAQVLMIVAAALAPDTEEGRK